MATMTDSATNAKPAFSASYWRGLMLVALVLGVAWINLTRLSQEANAQNRTLYAPMTGFLAPDFTLSTTDGEQIRLSALRDTPVVVNFWATWCPPCRAEMPALERLWQQYDRGSLMVLGVDQGESAQVVEQFGRATVGTTFPLLLDSRLRVGALYGVRALPTTFFIDAQGRIQDIKIGGPLNIATLLEGAAKIVDD